MHPDDIVQPLSVQVIAAATRLRLNVTPIEVQDISRFQCKYFKDFTIPEIPLAFELLAAGKLDVDEKFSHYGTLSHEYWGGVMKAMRKHRIEETRKEKVSLGTLDDNQTRIPTPEETKELNDKAMKDGVLESWGNFKKTNVMPYSMDSDLVTAHHYDWLRHKGVIEKPSDEMAIEIKKEAIEYQKEIVENRKSDPTLAQQRLKNESIKVGHDDNKEGKIQALCKKIAVRCFFEQLMIDGKELEELI